MSRNSRKDGFEWSVLAKQSAERAGFGEVACPLQGESFSVPGEVSPSVQVFFRPVTTTDTAPEAFLGVYIEAFEREWRRRLLLTNLPPEFESPPFAVLTANVRQLMERPWASNPPSDRDVVAVNDWLDRLFDYVKRLPSSMDTLVAAITANKIADHHVESYLGHPVKVRGFVNWLRRTHGVDLTDRLLPLLADRTEPYDVRTMLGAE